MKINGLITLRNKVADLSIDEINFIFDVIETKHKVKIEMKADTGAKNERTKQRRTKN
jgi:hypothetical protein